MFSSTHRQHLLVAFRHLDETLAEVLDKLGAPAGAPVFKRLDDDVDPSARARAADAVAEVRAEMRAFLAGHDLQPAAPERGATHVARSGVDTALVAAAELGPRHLRGYGGLSEREAEQLAALSERLRARLMAVLDGLPEPPP